MVIELSLYGIGVLSGIGIQYFTHICKVNSKKLDKSILVESTKVCSLCGKPLGPQAVKTHTGIWLCAEHKVNNN